MMKKQVKLQQNIWFSVAWIVAYCVLMSVGDVLSASFGLQKAVTLPIALTLLAILLAFLLKNNLSGTYGLCRPKCSAKAMLYYLPVFLMLTANLWFGIAVRYNAAETTFYILTMLCVGFLEELIFRGLLFQAMRKDSPRAAVIVSSVTFGIGHIINLVNGSGASLIPNLLQVVYATAAGFMFVMMYCRSKSLLPCIAAHGIFNALSVFARDIPSDEAQILSCVLLTAITGLYAIYLSVSLKKTADTYEHLEDGETR